MRFSFDPPSDELVRGYREQPYSRGFGGNIKDIDVTDKGKGKPLKVKIIYGYDDPKNDRDIILELGSKNAITRMDTRKDMVFQGFYERSENVVLDTFVIDGIKERLADLDTKVKGSKEQ